MEINWDKMSDLSLWIQSLEITDNKPIHTTKQHCNNKTTSICSFVLLSVRHPVLSSLSLFLSFCLFPERGDALAQPDWHYHLFQVSLHEWNTQYRSNVYGLPWSIQKKHYITKMMSPLLSVCRWRSGRIVMTPASSGTHAAPTNLI